MRWGRAAQQHGLGSIGIIRGEAEYASNATLTDAASHGMELHFVSRALYRRRHESSWLAELQSRFPDARLLPEGGSNLTAILACQRMLDSVDAGLLGRAETIACAVGTGATACGLSLRLRPDQSVSAYCVVPDPSRERRLQQWGTGAAPTPGCDPSAGGVRAPLWPA